MPSGSAESLVAEADGVDTRAALDAFLRGVERRAFGIAVVAVRDRDEALDIVQDAMIKLARGYARRPRAEWRPLFYRILSNQIRDWHRRRSVRDRIIAVFGRGDDAYDPVAEAPAPRASAPFERLASDTALDELAAALVALPARQREAFTLRALEGLDVAETAAAMGCSTGSVKTHHSRAVARLRQLLGEHEP